MAFFEGNNMTGGYGKGPDIINSCTVNVERGEIVSILGPNGAGKSTILELTKKTLEERNQDYIQVHFDAWLYQGYDDAKAALLETIASTLIKEAEGNKRLTDKAKEFAGRINKIRMMGLLMDGGAALAGVPTMGAMQRLMAIA